MVLLQHDYQSKYFVFKKVSSSITMSTEFNNASAVEYAELSDTLTVINDENKLPWGRLCSALKTLESIDLVEGSYSFGRGINNDVVITNKKIPENKFGNISKEHFQIVKEAGMPPVVKDYSKNGTFINEILIGKNKTRILQTHDKISVGFVNLTIYIYRGMESCEDNFLSPSLEKKYVTSQVLGRGSYGEVRLVYGKDTCQRYAVKKIKKSPSVSSKKHMNHADKIQREIQILKSVSHDCVVQVIEVEETQDNVFIVLEYLEGGELTNRILSIESLQESTVKFLFYQIVLAVQYLHSKEITHRDLKPQNILLSSQAPKARVKITDFGLSKLVNEDTFLRTKCGTPYYCAPEIWDEKNTVYDKKVDVWSLGVILYYMLAKELPFRAGNTENLGRLVLSGNYKFTGKVWGRLSNEVKDLITKMLTVDPLSRISINEDTGLQYEMAKFLNYIPEGTSGESFSSMEPPAKRLFVSKDPTDLTVRSWP